MDDGGVADWAVYIEARSNVRVVQCVPCDSPDEAEAKARLYVAEVRNARVWVLFRGERWMEAGHRSRNIAGWRIIAKGASA